jgi:hypothetical protein
MRTILGFVALLSVGAAVAEANGPSKANCPTSPKTCSKTVYVVAPVYPWAHCHRLPTYWDYLMARELKARSDYLEENAHVLREDAEGKHIENNRRDTEVFFDKRRMNEEDQLRRQQFHEQRIELAKKRTPPTAPKKAFSYPDEIAWPKTLEIEELSEARETVQTFVGEINQHGGHAASNPRDVVKSTKNLLKELRAHSEEVNGIQYSSTKSLLNKIQREAENLMEVEQLARQ